MPSRLAIFDPSSRKGLGTKLFGKDVANFQLFQALARHGGFDAIDFLMADPVDPATMRTSLLGDDMEGARIGTSFLNDQATARAAGTLLRGSQRMPDLAWLRRKAVGDAGYSLVGLIHTIAPPMVRQDIAAATLAPVQPWDAMICTSPAVQAAMRAMFDEWEDYLVERFDGSRRTRPQLPLIPLSIDGPAFAALADRPATRSSMRAEMGLAEGDVLLIWVGRLSFFEKAFPQPMMRAAEEAARASGGRLHFAMAGWFPSPATDEPAYRAAAAAYAPSVGFHIIDGNDRDRLGALWAAADIFISLVDNIQETFGIAPLEAMASGLPVVASDWDGYRYTIEHGRQGFLVPTLGGPDGILTGLVDDHLLGTRSYQQYAGVVAQHTAVHVGRAADAIAQLVRSPELRRTMGAAGRRRVADHFDHRVVAPQFSALAEELAAIRAKAVEPVQRPYIPVRGDPSRDFAGFATATLKPGIRMALRPGAGVTDLQRAAGLDLDKFAGKWRGTYEEAQRIVADLGEESAMDVAALLRRFPATRHRAVILSLLWLAKIGVIDWIEATDRQ